MNAELMRLISNIIRTGVIFDVNPQTRGPGAQWRTGDRLASLEHRAGGRVQCLGAASHR